MTGAPMQQTDVLIAGGGLAGSLTAAMLGRAGIDTVLVDPHPVYPPDFRCEKLDADQLHTLRLTGLEDAVLHASTADREFWIARYGRVIDRKPGDQRGILYDTLVNALRAQVPATTPLVQAKVMDIGTGPERQTVMLSNGEAIAARLVVIATGLNLGLRQKLGINRKTISAGHSVSIGFDVQPAGRLPFTALTWFAQSPSEKMAYLTLFPIGATLRANLFGYRDFHDPWLKQFRDTPEQMLDAMWPRLRRVLGDYTVEGPVKIRPVDLIETEGYKQDGIVLVGDAFSTSCPAAGNGARKVLVDVERLCNIYIPRWLATPGMGQAKVASFYADPVKRACDTRSTAKAFSLRSFSIGRAPRWMAMRLAKFVLHWGQGTLRRIMAARTAPGVTDGAEDEAPRLAPSTPARD